MKMTTKYIGIAMAFMAATTLWSCSEDDLSSTSVFDGEETTEQSEFDKWLQENYVKDYNISFQYRYIDRESNMSYDVVPAEYDKSIGMAKLLKHVWLDAYTEVAGDVFVKKYAFKVVQLIGSFQYLEDESRVLGTAEGGLKIMLYGINHLDLDNVLVDADDPFNQSEGTGNTPLNCNYFYFHTMHHEFCHILTQTKDYTTDFRSISVGKYHASDWQTLSNATTAPDGFVSAYASKEYNEDFAEVYSTYVTSSDTGWQKVLTMAGDEGSAIIEQKLDIVKAYFRDSWGIDIDKVREVVLRRSQEAPELDLHTLN